MHALSRGALAKHDLAATPETSIRSESSEKRELAIDVVKARIQTPSRVRREPDLAAIETAL